MLFIAGVAALAAGALLVVRGAGRAGVCVPALAVAVAAAAHDRPALAVGTVVGGNVAAVGLVLGLAAVVRPIRGPRVLATALPLVLVSTLVFWFLVRDNVLSRVDAVVLLVAFAAVAAYSHRAGWLVAVTRPARREIAVALLGVAVTAGGAVMIVRAAGDVARAAGASELMFGLTAVAAATTLPALVLAVRRPDAALATVIGLCVANALLVGGATGLVLPLRVSDGILMQELPAMALFALLLFPCLASGLRVSRWEGAVLLAAYLGFVAWQVRTAVR